jgi:hypothetical protein
MGGWMDGWMDGWMEVKAVLRIAYSNQKFPKLTIKMQVSFVNEAPGLVNLTQDSLF